MWYLASFVAFVACVKMLTVTRDPVLAAGVFTASKVLLALFIGGFSAILITGAIAGFVSIGYFWLLDRLDGSRWWWVLLAGGVVLLA